MQQINIQNISIEDQNILLNLSDGKDIASQSDNIYRLLGDYHRSVSKNYSEMERYYLMAIELGDVDSMKKLAIYYSENTNPLDPLKYIILTDKYFLMSINLGNIEALELYVKYYNEKKLSVIMYSNFSKFYQSNEECHELIINKLKENIPWIETQIKFENKNNKLFEHLYDNYIKDNLFCDVIPTDFLISSKEKEYKIHSTVLNSDYFIALLDKGFKSQKEINSEFSNKTIELFIQYLYTNKFDYQNIEKEVIKELIVLSDQYIFEDLKRSCKWILLL